MDYTSVKQRYGIIGNDLQLQRAIDTAVQVASTKLSVLVIGENGSGKEAFARIIHDFSPRKHQTYVSLNCGAIPEGTIDSELFGHEKGSFTGAVGERKGYFEEANGSTIFLDEIGELPMQTQAKLLRVLERGEYLRVGSSQVRKTDVRVVAATNVNLEKAIAEGRFRQDLFYRLNGITINIPPLRKRKEDIPALFNKFTNDFASSNNRPPVRLSPGAKAVLTSYDWPGNIRQLKNVAEQVTALAQNKDVDEETMLNFIGNQPRENGQLLLPQIDGGQGQNYNTDRDLLYKLLFDMRNDVTDLKSLVLSLINNGRTVTPEALQLVQRLYPGSTSPIDPESNEFTSIVNTQEIQTNNNYVISRTPNRKPIQADIEVTPLHPGSKIATFDDATTISSKEINSLADNERETIIRVLAKCKNNRRQAARELQISERTLYRKINEYGLGKK